MTQLQQVDLAHQRMRCELAEPGARVRASLAARDDRDRERRAAEAGRAEEHGQSTGGQRGQRDRHRQGQSQIVGVAMPPITAESFPLPIDANLSSVRSPIELAFWFSQAGRRVGPPWPSAPGEA